MRKLCRIRDRKALGLAVVVALSLLLAAGFPPRAFGSDGETAAQDAGNTSSHGALIDTFVAGTEQNQGLAVATSEEGVPVVARFYGASGANGEGQIGASAAFEWGRCSDLIVWACVMQLVEQGSLDLDDPVRTLLPEGVQLPEGYEGLDVVDLMNHAAGLDVAMVGAAATIPDRTMSARVALGLFSVNAEFRPGAIVGYTPYDAVLGAVIVENVAGMDFGDYVRKNVIERLGLNGTYFMVGGSASRLAASQDAPAQASSLVPGSQGPQSISSPRPATSSAFVCFGPIGDLLTLANAAMGFGDKSLFDDPETVERFFTVSRTYPSLGVARIAHGLFAFPFTNGVFGISGTTSSGFSSSVYMDHETGTAIVVLVDESGRADLTQGIPRVIFGRSDAVVANASSPANNMWIGTYQDAGRANHGPSKLLTALERMLVSVNDQGVLTFDGVTAASLGAGVYSIDTAIDQDVYRFHVSLERGAEFSRVTTDSYSVPFSTLILERVLLIGAAVAVLVSLACVLGSLWRWLRARVRHLRCSVQGDVVVLSLANVVAGATAVSIALGLAEGLLPAALDALLVVETVYLGVASVLSLWILVTRWRGRLWTRRQNMVCAFVVCSVFVLAMNLVYWEMLP